MMRERPSPPRYDDAPEAYDPFDGPWEAYDRPHDRFTFADLWWAGVIAIFFPRAAETVVGGHALGFLLLDAAISALTAFGVAAFISGGKRVKGSE